MSTAKIPAEPTKAKRPSPSPQDSTQAFPRAAAHEQFVQRVLGAQNAYMGRPFDIHELADLGQDVLVLIWQRTQLQAEEPPQPWIRRVCFHVLMNLYRRRHHRPHSEGIDPETMTHSDPELARLEALDEISRCLNQLQEDHAQLLRMRHMESLTFEEMASRLGLAVSAVKARYYRARVKLEEGKGKAPGGGNDGR